MVYTQQGVHIVHGLRADVSELLDLGGGILDLTQSHEWTATGWEKAKNIADLVIGEVEPELLDSRLDSVPASETMPDRTHQSRAANEKQGAYPIETYRVRPKSSGFKISYVLGLFKIAFAWMPALCVKAQ